MEMVDPPQTAFALSGAASAARCSAGGFLVLYPVMVKKSDETILVRVLGGFSMEINTERLA